MNRTQKYRVQRGARAGQAIAELVVGLIALLVVIMGMLQIQSLALAHTQTLNDARAEAGGYALDSSYIPHYSPPVWISDINPGRDKIRYSQDDQKMQGSPSLVTDGIVAHANPAELSKYASGNELSAASSAYGLMNELYLTHGRQRSQVETFPLIRSIVYNADVIQLQSDVWLSWTHIENVK